MYSKPELQKFGSMRELTLLGLDQDCDGGVWGIADGTWLACSEDRS